MTWSVMVGTYAKLVPRMVSLTIYEPLLYWAMLVVVVSVLYGLLMQKIVLQASEFSVASI